jgi:hypothetical protein
MAAAANKPTAVHFALVVFVMFTLVLGLVLYLYVRDYNLAAADAKKATDDLNAEKGRYNSLLAQATELKTLLGYQYDGLGAAGENNSVIGEAGKDITALGGAQAGNTYKQTLANLRSTVDTLTAENQTQRDNLNRANAQLQALLANAQGRVDQHQQSQQSSEQQLQQLIAKRDELLREKDAIITKWQEDFRLVQAEKEQAKDELERVRREKDERIALLETQLDVLNYQVAERVREALRSANVPSDLVNYIFGEVELVLKDRFETADAEIVSVDNTTRTVWLNIGHLDGLRPQVSFSVYTSDNRGFGRGDRDIKAKVEVTRIMDGHLSEARILEEDLFRPIAAGDPVYSPIWSAGRTEYFATVGRLDLDEDGVSDMDLFREIVRNAGGRIGLTVDEEGVRQPANAKINAQTKFLIIGDIDDPSEFSGQPEKQQLIERILAEQKALIDEARLFGVQPVRLNDFLSYIGFRPQSRLWRPGEERPFTLRQGAQSAAVDETFTDRTSSGQVSELFRRNRTGLQQSSDGNTSGLFRGK